MKVYHFVSPITQGNLQNSGGSFQPESSFFDFLMDSPFKSILWALCISRSQMASATVGLAMISCHLEIGNCEVMMVEWMEYLSSSNSSRINLLCSSTGGNPKSSMMRRLGFCIGEVSLAYVHSALAIFSFENLLV